MTLLAIVLLVSAVAALSALAQRAGRPLAPVEQRRAVDRIDALLPQTQCERCGFPGCRPYAEAIAAGEAAINRCPPGGEATVGKLAELLGDPVLPLDVSRGRPGGGLIARIDHAVCIGCTKCIAPCPTDAVVGAAGQLHEIIDDRCTGCGLCLPPCPVDCITLAEVTA